MNKHRLRVGITVGDPSGIGPEITAKGLKQLKGLADFKVIGPSQKIFGVGKPRAEYGKAAIGYLDKALELIRNKQIDCLVTCPVSKEAVNLAGFKFSGHTEYLARRTGTKDFAMMLLNKEMRFSLVTRHIPLKDVPSSLNIKGIVKTVFLACQGLKELFSIRNPRLAVCGLNPHASDNGLIGEEENKIIRPALRKVKTKFKNIFGPFPADTAIARAREFDCVITMYHDQALIPLKLSAKGTGVNLTLGLPFVRTSPLHGTAFDIAGKNRADPSSFIEAVKLAIRCSLNQ